jgi:hypothetical protein
MLNQIRHGIKANIRHHCVNSTLNYSTNNSKKKARISIPVGRPARQATFRVQTSFFYDFHFSNLARSNGVVRLCALQWRAGERPTEKKKKTAPGRYQQKQMVSSGFAHAKKNQRWRRRRSLLGFIHRRSIEAEARA